MRKFLYVALVLVMVLAMAAPAMAGNDKVINNYLEGAELKQDFNNAQFHCNGINGNGRVWPVIPADMKKFNGQLTFTKADGTKWILTGVREAIVDGKGKATGTYVDRNMVVCPECGSTQWITFSNNSGVPDGKNVQMQHPGESIVIVKQWEKNNAPYADGTKFSATFAITYTIGGKDYSFKVGPGKFFIPGDIIEASIKVEEISCTPAGFKLVDSEVVGNVYTFYNADEPPAVPTGTFNIAKTVGGVPFNVWAEGKSEADINAIKAGMEFTAYSLDNPGMPPIVGNLDNLVEMGIVTFGEVPVGNYRVEEKISDKALDVFVDKDNVITYEFYVGEGGTKTESISYISGKDFGTPVFCDRYNCVVDGNFPDHDLPGTWDRVLKDQPAYEALKKMGAEWVWGDAGVAEAITVDTHIYGKSGSIYEDGLTFVANKAGSTTAYIAADNAAAVYVNGELAGYTVEAYKSANNKPADFYSDFDFTALSADIFSGGWSDGWNHSYAIDFDFIAGENTVIVIALNSAYTPEGPNADYNEKTNPCGLLFGFVIEGATFDNEPIVAPAGMLAAELEISAQQKITEYGYRPNTSSINDTLVTQGGEMDGRGFTINEVSIEDGGRFEVAYSGNNGSNSNAGIGVYYTVKVDGRNIIITFDDAFVTGSITFKAFADKPIDKFDGSSHVTNNTGIVTIPLPVDAEDTFWLFFHSESFTYFNGTHTRYVVKDKVEPVNYTGSLSLVIENEESEVVWQGVPDFEIGFASRFAIPGTFPVGKYTATLSGNDFEDVVKEGEILHNGDDVTFDFGKIVVKYPDKVIDNPPA